jgi:hypothetical protein
MAWAPGPSEVASISIGGTSTNGNLIENFSLETAEESYTTGYNFEADRGFVTKTGSFDCLDYSKVTALETLMTNRSLNTAIVTYTDSDTQTMTSNTICRVKPIVNIVSDVCNVYILAQAGSYDDLTTNFTDLGVAMSDPSFEFDYPSDETDGCGRPYFGGSCRVTAEVMLSGIRGATTDVYALAKAFQNTNVDVAFAMPNGNFMVLEDVYAYAYHAGEDAAGARMVRLKITGVAAAWSSTLKYTNGSATADTNGTDGWGVETNGVDPGNGFAGANVEFVGTHYSEDTLTSFAVV